MRAVRPSGTMAVSPVGAVSVTSTVASSARRSALGVSTTSKPSLPVRPRAAPPSIATRTPATGPASIRLTQKSERVAETSE